MRIRAQNGVIFSNTSNISTEITTNNQQTDCLLIVENLHIHGIFTPSDIVKLILSKSNFTKIKIAEVMTRQVVTLKQSQNHDIFTALQLMRQHGIGYLPILDEQEHLVGIVTQDSLLQALDLQALQQHRSQKHICYESHIQASFRAYFKNNILNRVSDAVVGIDSEHHIVYLNQAAEQLYNIKLEEFLGRHLEEAYDYRWLNPEDEQASYDALSATGAWQGENIHIKNNGEEIFVESSVSVLSDNHGENIGFLAVIRDITKRKRAEIALQASEERFRSLIEISSDWVWEVNEYGFLTYASPKVFNILGYTPQEIIGQTPFDLMAPWETQRLSKVINSFVREKQPFKNLENINLHKDGHSVVVETSGVPIFDASGEFRGYRGTDRDITERFQAQDKLRESEERFRLLVTHVPVGIFQTDNKGECIFVNPRWSEIAGISPDESMGKGWTKAIHPEDREQVVSAWYEAFTAGRGFTLEVRFRTPEGKVSWVVANATAIRNQTGEITGYLGTVTDITSRKQVEDKLRLTEALLQEAQIIAKIGSWSRDLTTNERWWSEQFYRTINLNPGDAMPNMETLINTIVHPDERDRIYQLVMDCIERGIPYETEVRFLRPDNSFGYLFLCGRVERDSQGNLNRYYGVSQDISEYKQVELELRESKERYHSAIKSLHEGIVIQQADGTITSCNPSAQRILGLSASEMKGRDSYDPRWRTIHEDGSPFRGETHPPMIALQTGKPCLYTVMGVHKPNGELTWILIVMQQLLTVKVYIQSDRENLCVLSYLPLYSTPFGANPSTTPIIPLPCSVSATITSTGLAVAQ